MIVIFSKQRLLNCCRIFGDVMFGLVLFDIIGSSTWETALWALVWFFSGVERRCPFRYPAWRNELSPSLHWCDFSPLWVSTCLIRSDFVIEEKSHHLRWFGFCKECVLMWYLRWPACEDALSYSGHLCGFSPLWKSMCCFRFPARPNDSPHCAQCLLCSVRYPCIQNDPVSTTTTRRRG